MNQNRGTESFKLLTFFHRLPRKEKLFLIVFLLLAIYWIADWLTGIDLPWWGGLLDLSFFILTAVLGVIYLRRIIRRSVWRLRNRLIITYVFIGVVPIVLILAMLAIASYILMGQVATYLVTTELNRRNELLRDSAYVLGWNVADRIPAKPGEVAANEFFNELHKRLPGLQAVVRATNETFSFPANAGLKEFPAWSEPGFLGLVRTGNEYALAAHVEASGASRNVEVFAYEPADPELLASLLPGLASVHFLELDSASSESEQRGGELRVTGRISNPVKPSTSPLPLATLPPPKSWWDVVVNWGTPLTARLWKGEDSHSERALIAVVSRPSLIISRLFSTLEELASTLKVALMVIGALFLLVEFASFIFGVSLTRSITRSIAELYEGTRKIKAGDFSHRIPIRSTDQLSELAGSFNGMTENIQKFIVELQEKERLESELEIAREVQTQLFPKEIPRLKTLELSGLCTPARVVSGDYYDFVPIDSCQTALAIGDVAGKGISAALLMASIQSSLRAQLSLRNGAKPHPLMETPLSTAELVALLNRQLYESTTPEKFASFYCGVYDDQSSLLFYTNAGHLPPILIRKGKASRLKISGMVIGAFPGVPYDQDCLGLEPGDLLVAFTDGITEPENEYGEEFGEKRLTDLLIRNAQKPLDWLIGAVMTAVSEWKNNPEQQDDMTLLLARRVS